jgi:hypothetical protein
MAEVAVCVRFSNCTLYLLTLFQLDNYRWPNNRSFYTLVSILTSKYFGHNNAGAVVAEILEK